MVTIRLARGGAKKRPFYYVTVCDARRSRDGRYIERIGFFNPVARGAEKRLRIDLTRASYWSDQGAKISDRVSALLKEAEKETGSKLKLTGDKLAKVVPEAMESNQAESIRLAENPIKYDKNPLISGYISKENLQTLSSTVPFKIESVGNGKILSLIHI